MRSSRLIRLGLCVACGFAIAFLGGCGGTDGPQRAIVSGNVVFEGKPVAQGRIRFAPVGAPDLPTSGAYIVDGRYRADSHGGVPIGTHRVQIEAYSPTDPAMLPGNGGKLAAPTSSKAGLGLQFLPDKYNANTQLQITIEPKSGSVTKDFELTD